MTKQVQRRPIEQYEHPDKTRKNNPPVGLVTAGTDPQTGKKTYAYDPHLDPQLAWTGKAERTSFEVPTVSLHVHERIDPRTIIEALKKPDADPEMVQPYLFETRNENPPLREAIDFYQHDHAWSNRLVAGDSLLVMNSLLEKEGLAGQVQMIYIDPPYGIKYGSNFQPFVNRRDVKDGKDEDLTQEPETIRAFRDTWELGIHSYLTYLRDRLLLARELLHESGSVFVQISNENLHHVRELMDELFGAGNFAAVIPFKKTSALGSVRLDSVNDYLVWYAKDTEVLKYRQLYSDPGFDTYAFPCIELPDGTWKRLTSQERRTVGRADGLLFRPAALTSQSGSESTSFLYQLDGRTYRPSAKTYWKTNYEGMERLRKAGRLLAIGNTLTYKRYQEDFPVRRITNWWDDTVQSTFAIDKIYVVQTYTKVIARCLLMTTDPGDLVLDPTCGSGTTAYVAEQWGRRWITCDTSRVAVTLARQRLMTGLFDYYELAHPDEGVSSGFTYRTVPHITLKSIANNEPPTQETLYDQPLVDKSRARVTGPFTVEAVPAPTVMPVAMIEGEQQPADGSVARTGPTLKHTEWRDELHKTGIRGERGQKIEFSRVEPLGGTRYLHVDAETKEDMPRRVAVSFGPEHAPLEQTQVERAWEEAMTLFPRPALLVFAAFQFDPEAAKDIDELAASGRLGMTLLKVQMNTDLLTADLKKKSARNESFWLIGQPDVELRRVKQGEHAGKYQVEVHGFDYYNTRTGAIESGDTAKIALWLLDTDYDGRSLYPRQVFFPLAGEKDGWSRVAKNLKAQLDEEHVEAYRGTVSLPFELGDRRRIAVKIVDDRGIESLKIVEAE